MRKIYEYSKVEYETLKKLGKIQEIPLLEQVKDPETGELRDMTGYDIRMITKEPQNGHILNFISNINPKIEFEMIHHNFRPVAIIDDGVTYIVIKDDKFNFFKYDINLPISERLEKHTRIKVQKYLSENLNEMKNNRSKSRNEEFIMHTEFNNFIQKLPKQFLEFEEVIKSDKYFFKMKHKHKDIEIIFNMLPARESENLDGSIYKAHYLMQPVTGGKDIDNELKEKILKHKRYIQMFDFSREKYKVFKMFTEYTKDISETIKEHFKEEIAAKIKVDNEKWKKWDEEQRKGKIVF